MKPDFIEKKRRPIFEYISNTIKVLNERFSNQDFDFGSQYDRLSLAMGLKNNQYDWNAQ